MNNGTTPDVAIVTARTKSPNIAEGGQNYVKRVLLKIGSLRHFCLHSGNSMMATHLISFLLAALSWE
jgi:hypothetical protein